MHGKHNTVYLLGSIHVLRPEDYPLAPAVLHAYSDAKALLMEINLDEIDSAQVQGEMLSGAMLPEGKTLPVVLGPQRYAHAASLAHDAGVDLSMFDQFAPWFAAEAISQLQLGALGFQAQSGVEMYFLGRARTDGKSIAGLETVHDQIALFEALSLDEQAEYLVASLEQARELPKEVDDMVHAWQRGDTAWFENEINSEWGHDPALYQSMLGVAQPQVAPEDRGAAQRRQELSRDRRHRPPGRPRQRHRTAEKRRGRRHPALSVTTGTARPRRAATAPQGARWPRVRAVLRDADSPPTGPPASRAAPSARASARHTSAREFPPCWLVRCEASVASDCATSATTLRSSGRRAWSACSFR